MEAQNNSSVKTRRLIRQTFAELVKEKHDIDRISVTELCKRANITRGTFYFHYDNLYDVVDELREEIFDTFFDYDNTSNCDIDYYFDHVADYLKSNTEIYKMLISVNSLTNFTNHLKRHLYENLHHCLTHHQHKHYPTLELDAEFFTDAAVCLIGKFFQGETSLSLDQINVYLKDMFHRIFA